MKIKEMTKEELKKQRDLFLSTLHSDRSEKSEDLNLEEEGVIQTELKEGAISPASPKKSPLPQVSPKSKRSPMKSKASSKNRQHRKAKKQKIGSLDKHITSDDEENADQ